MGDEDSAGCGPRRTVNARRTVSAGRLCDDNWKRFATLTHGNLCPVAEHRGVKSQRLRFAQPSHSQR